MRVRIYLLYPFFHVTVWTSLPNVHYCSELFWVFQNSSSLVRCVHHVLNGRSPQLKHITVRAMKWTFWRTHNHLKNKISVSQIRHHIWKKCAEQSIFLKIKSFLQTEIAVSKSRAQRQTMSLKKKLIQNKKNQ